MRITSGMLVQQLVQAVKNEGLQKPEVGAVITARISQVLNGVLTLDVGSGNPVIAKDLSGRNFQQGQTVSFVVAGFDEGGTLQIRPSADGTSTDSDIDAMTPMLKNMNLPDTPDNRELLHTLSAYRIPLTAENIKAAQDMRIQTKGILLLTDQTGTAVLAENEDATLKQIAGKLVEMTGSSGKGALLRVPSPGQLSEKAPAAGIPALTEELVAAAGVKAETDSAEVGKSADKMPITPKNGIPVTGEKPGQADPLKLSASAISDAADEVPLTGKGKLAADDPRGTELKEILKQLTFDKIVFVLKNQLPSDVKTLETMEKLLAGKKDLGIQLNELLGNLPEDAGDTLKEIIRTIGKTVQITPDMNPFDLQKQLKTISQGLSALSAQLSETVLGNQKMQESLSEVKSSLDFLSRLNESATYLHMPVMLGQGTKPMDLYVQRDKSGKKKVNPKDTKIFISLETNHMETVQCLVDVGEKKLDIGFKLKDEDVLSIISGIFEPLKESLNLLGYTDVMIHGMIYEKRLNLMDIVQEPVDEIRQIDMRV